MFSKSELKLAGLSVVSRKILKKQQCRIFLKYRFLCFALFYFIFKFNSSCENMRKNISVLSKISEILLYIVLLATVVTMATVKSPRD